MLTRLSIRNIVLIEALDLEFGAGLGVLTGETGAGKSILLDALGLVLGARADTGLIRVGETEASVIACFDFAKMPVALADVLGQAGFVIDPGEALILRRQLRVSNANSGQSASQSAGQSAGQNESVSSFTSRAFINDSSVSAGLLRDIAPYLVEVHGQHDDRGLVSPRGHRALLDRFAGVSGEGGLLGVVAQAWRAWQQSESALAEARNALARAGAERDLTQSYLAELDRLAPVAGEEEQLALSRAAMQKGERLAGDMAELQRLWQGSDSPVAAIRLATRRLERIASEHPALGEALAALDRTLIEAGDAEAHLEAAREALAHDPQALDTIEVRLFDLRGVARKHGCSVDDLASLALTMRAELAALEHGEEGINALARQAVAAAGAYREAAQKLSRIRAEAAIRLDRAVAGELAPLRLDAARFRTAREVQAEARWGAGGCDAVEFLVATNQGADFAPLGKIASGGELSRFILALKVALAGEGGAAAMIFDEIDRGVGGAVASAIGERLARLSAGNRDKGDEAGAQVLVVTHAPQVAARASRHYVIAKSSDGLVTRTSVVLLDEEERRHEIARMLSGNEITPEARAQAERLLAGV